MSTLINKLTDLFMYILEKTTSNELLMLFWTILIIAAVISMMRKLWRE